jgi:hypothetical protein
MAILPQPSISAPLMQAIDRSVALHSFIATNTHGSFVDNHGGKKLLIATLFFLAQEILKCSSLPLLSGRSGTVKAVPNVPKRHG